MAKVAVIIAAAGKGERFGSNEKKTFAKLDGSPVFLRSVQHFVNRDDVCQTILVVGAEDVGELKKKYAANLGFMGVQLVEGGDERYASIARAVERVTDEADLIAVHDAVRPCVSTAMIDAVFAEAEKTGAAILAAPLRGTINRASDAGVIDETIPREGLYEAQTPQVFKRELLCEAYAALGETDATITDDAQVVERTGHPVSIVESDGTNLKITTKPDMTLAAAILKARPAPVKKAISPFEEAQW
jgi:2-C-methyl-D-erythritol 4-phosphate cytidylyltransferase